MNRVVVLMLTVAILTSCVDPKVCNEEYLNRSRTSTPIVIPLEDYCVSPIDSLRIVSHIQKNLNIIMLNHVVIGDDGYEILLSQEEADNIGIPNNVYKDFVNNL